MLNYYLKVAAHVGGNLIFEARPATAIPNWSAT
jgi:hypothetical protein